jgi:dihydropteroate synthase
MNFHSSEFLRCGRHSLDFHKPHVMGVINVTPDSFSDGGELVISGRVSLDKTLERAMGMVEAGAKVLDIGGESTRPGAAQVSAQEEIDRVIPVVELLNRECEAVISVDTSNPEIIRLAARAGAGLINDVRALEREGALGAAQSSGLPVCLMHMQGQPDTMQVAPHYKNVVKDITDYLGRRVLACVDAGIPREKLLIDPGFGFGKSLEHNLQLLANLEQLKQLGLPMLIGMSRKGMIGALTGKDEKGRMAGSVAAAVIAVMKGAWIIRAHDVTETVDALKICAALMPHISGMESIE